MIDSQLLILDSRRGAYTFPQALEFRKLAVKVSSSNRRESWIRAGWVKIMAPVIGFESVEALAQLLALDVPEMLILREDQPFENYQIRFEPVPWLQEYTIEIRGIVEN